MKKYLIGGAGLLAALLIACQLPPLPPGFTWPPEGSEPLPPPAATPTPATCDTGASAPCPTWPAGKARDLAEEMKLDDDISAYLQSVYPAVIAALESGGQAQTLVGGAEIVCLNSSSGVFLLELPPPPFADDPPYEWSEEYGNATPTPIPTDADDGDSVPPEQEAQEGEGYNAPTGIPSC